MRQSVPRATRFITRHCITKYSTKRLSLCKGSRQNWKSPLIIRKENLKNVTSRKLPNELEKASHTQVHTTRIRTVKVIAQKGESPSPQIESAERERERDGTRTLALIWALTARARAARARINARVDWPSRAITWPTIGEREDPRTTMTPVISRGGRHPILYDSTWCAYVCVMSAWDLFGWASGWWRPGEQQHGFILGYHWRGECGIIGQCIGNQASL